MGHLIKIIFSIILIISPSFSYVVFREDPVIFSNNEAIDLIDGYPITEKPMSIEHRQKIPKKNDKNSPVQQQHQLTVGDLTTYLGLNDNYFGGSKSLAKELQTLLSAKNEQRSLNSDQSKSNENELTDINSNESSSTNGASTSLTNSNQEPLNFGEVLTLLALWHIANAFNDYSLEEQKGPMPTNPSNKQLNYNDQRR